MLIDETVGLEKYGFMEPLHIYSFHSVYNI